MSRGRGKEAERDCVGAEGELTLSSVAFGTGSGAESAVRVVARQNVGDGELAVELVERVEMSECRDGTVEEAGVGLAPLVALNRAVGKL